MYSKSIGSIDCRQYSVPDLPLCLGVHKHRGPFGQGGGPSSCKKQNYDGFLLMWCNYKFEGVLFRSDSRHNDRVDSLWECVCVGLPGIPPSGPK